MKISYNGTGYRGWVGGARLERLHDMGYNLSYEDAAGYVIWREHPNKPDSAVVKGLSEDEMNRYVSLLVGSDDGEDTEREC